MIVSQLTINPSKSSFFIIQPHYTKNKKVRNIAGFYLKLQDNDKYLGIHSDQRLNFKCHTEEAQKHAVKASGILWKVRKFFPEKKHT